MRRTRSLLVLIISMVLPFSLLPPLLGSAAAKKAPGPIPVARAVMFGSDGMRPDLMERYAKLGLMPTYRSLMKSGVRGANGMVQAFPPNTGVGWYTMATGTYPGEHGSTNNTFHRTGEAFDRRTSFASAVALQADTIAASAERAGKKVAQVDWVGGLNSNIAGPTVDFANFFSRSGVLVQPLNPDEKAGADAFGLNYQVAEFIPADPGWTNVPAGDPAAPSQEVKDGWSIPTSFAAQNPDRTYNVYVYDSVVDGNPAYDHAVVATVGRDGSPATALDLAVGDFDNIKLTGTNGLIGPRLGQTAGQYIKLVTLSADISNFKLYTTSIARAQAKCGTPACAALPHLPGEDPLEAHIANNLPTWIAADFAPLEARIIDEDTYVEQGGDLEAGYGDAVLQFILGTLQPDTQLAMVGYPVTDEFSHQFMGLVTPTDIDGNPNPYFDNLDGQGPPDGRLAIREGYIRSSYRGADAKLALIRSLMGGNPTTIAASDHGFAPQWWAVNARRVLFDNKVNGIPLQGSGENTASNCGAVAVDLSKACWAGGTIQIYVNPSPPSGSPSYEEVRTAVINAFQNLTDPANPGAQVVSKVMRKEELRNVDGSDSLHPNRSGDVVVVLRPPYQSDAGTPGKQIAFSQFFGQHGYLPNLVDLVHNVNLRATFVAAGPGIRRQNPVSGIRAIDLAPTVAFLLGVPGPQNARGRIMYNLAPNPGRFKEFTILDISDYHGQLIPLAEAADSVGPSFAIGGSAFLKPWFDLYRAEAAMGSITVAGGDSVGATPPISSFFGDTPTIELMNMMGFSADALGNHNFDKGEQYLRKTLIPLANYPFVSSNIVDDKGKTPREWKKSAVFSKVFAGGKLGVVGFSNDDLPDLIFPGALGPFHVENSADAVNAEAAKLKKAGVGLVVALGHLGATGGSITDPTGPLADLAAKAKNVDAVIGDHTDFQVLAYRGDGVPITENRSKGIRFTRIRITIDTSNKSRVYATADFHKPWDIGITPNAAIQARIDELNEELKPLLGKVIGESTVFIPRADSCGNGAGRTCESLVGNVIGDSMQKTYEPIGVQFAITNSGGLRADLTCPITDDPNDFCPQYTPPPYPISRGQVLTVLPFGNIVVTLDVDGAELKTMLENGVSQMPAVAGRFPQVSGLCFTYDITQNPGSRVTGAVFANPDGTCTANPIDLTAGSIYKIAENDFMVNGGDGYPNFFARSTSQGIMDQVAADYITANTPISPSIQGRINCIEGGGPLPNKCPLPLP